MIPEMIAVLRAGNFVYIGVYRKLLFTQEIIVYTMIPEMIAVPRWATRLEREEATRLEVPNATQGT